MTFNSRCSMRPPAALATVLKLIKIVARVVRHDNGSIFQFAEVAVNSDIVMVLSGRFRSIWVGIAVASMTPLNR